MIDFWVKNSLTSAGQPRTWFDPLGSSSFSFRGDSEYMGHLRISSEGAEAVIRAWKLLKEKTQWLQYSVSYGEFLLARQAADGSILGSWKWDGTPWNNVTNGVYPYDAALT